MDKRCDACRCKECPFLAYGGKCPVEGNPCGTCDELGITIACGFRHAVGKTIKQGQEG